MWSGRTLQPLNANCPCPVPLAGFRKDTAGRGESEFSQSSGSIGICALHGPNTWTNNHVTIGFLYWKNEQLLLKKSLEILPWKICRKHSKYAIEIWLQKKKWKTATLLFQKTVQCLSIWATFFLSKSSLTPPPPLQQESRLTTQSCS